MPSTASLPPELVDVILDVLATQHTNKALIAPSLVSSGWLRRSRYHLFSTLTLQHAHIPPFIALVKAEHSSLGPSIRSIAIDANWAPTCREDDRSPELINDFVQSVQTLVDPSLRNLASLGFQNMDWTALPPNILSHLRHLLSTAPFRHNLYHLSFTNVTFHDLRELLSLLKLCPNVSRLSTVGLSFLKYRNQACAEAAKGGWKVGIREMEVDGTHAEDGLAIALSWLVAAYERKDDVKIERLSVKGIRPCDAAVVKAALKHARPSLRHLTMAFGSFDPVLSRDDFLKTFKLSKMPHLSHLSLEGIHCSSQVSSPAACLHVREALPGLLATLESPFLRSIDLGFVQCEQHGIDMKWTDLRKPLQELCFFGVNQINIDLVAEGGDMGGKEALRETVVQALPEIHRSGILKVNI